MKPIRCLLTLPFRLAGYSLALFLAWQVWVFLQPRPKPLEEGEQRAARKAVEQFSADVAAKVQGPARFGLIHIVKDSHNQVAAELRDVLERNSGWTASTNSILQQFMGDVSEAVGNATSVEEVVKAGHAVALDLIVGGRLAAVSTTNQTRHVTLNLFAYDLKQGAWAVRGAYSGSWAPGLTQRWLEMLRGLTGIEKIGLLLLVLLPLPWLTRPLIGQVLGRKSNAAAFLLVLGYTLAGITWSWVLLGDTAGPRTWLVLLASLAVYNFWSSERVAEGLRE